MIFFRLLNKNMVKLWRFLAFDFPGVTVLLCRTQRQCGKVDGVAVRAVTPFISSPDLEGVYRAWNQRADSHRVGLTVHTRCTFHVGALGEAEGHFYRDICHLFRIRLASVDC